MPNVTSWIFRPLNPISSSSLQSTMPHVVTAALSPLSLSHGCVPKLRVTACPFSLHSRNFETLSVSLARILFVSLSPFSDFSLSHCRFSVLHQRPVSLAPSVNPNFVCEEVSSGDPSVHMSTHHCDPSRLSSRKDTDFRPDSSCYLTIFIRLCQYPFRGNASSGKATCKAPRVMTSLRETSPHGRVPVT